MGGDARCQSSANVEGRRSVKRRDNVPPDFATSAGRAEGRDEMYDSDAPALILSVRVPQSNPRPSARVRSCDREQTCGKDAPTHRTGHELNNTLAQDPSTLRVNQHHPISSCLEQLVEDLVQRVAGFSRVRLVGGWVVVCGGDQSATERHDTAEETGSMYY